MIHQPKGICFSKICHEISVDNLAQAMIARQVARCAAAELGFDKKRQAEAVLVASELAHNHVMHHTVKGKIRIVGVVIDSFPLLNITSLDEGPGIEQVPEVLNGKIATDSGLGAGLGAVARFSNQMAVCSGKKGPASCMLAEIAPHKWATVISCNIWPGHVPPWFYHQGERDFFCLLQAKRSNSYCGDGIQIITDNRYIRIAVADGAGHGKKAYSLAMKAFSLLEKEALFWPPASLIKGLEEPFRTTPGLSLHVLLLDCLKGRFMSAGIGSITAIPYINGTLMPVANDPGVIGHHGRTVLSNDFDKVRNLVVIMHTDG